MMDIPQFIQRLIGDGFSISLSEDGEKIKLSSSGGKLDDERRKYIQEHRDEIVAHLRKRAWNPKVAKGATHYIMARAQRRIAELHPKLRKEYIAQLVQHSTPVWEAFQEQDRWKLMAALTALDSFAKEQDLNAKNAVWKQTPQRSTVSNASKNTQG